MKFIAEQMKLVVETIKLSIGNMKSLVEAMKFFAVNMKSIDVSIKFIVERMNLACGNMKLICGNMKSIAEQTLWTSGRRHYQETKAGKELRALAALVPPSGCCEKAGLSERSYKPQRSPGPAAEAIKN